MVEVIIAGAGCRVAGASNLDEFKALLERGECAVRPAPQGRWSVERFFHPDRSAAGFSYSFAGGYLDNPFDFDPTVFGISPREAIEMDPQQRLLLEVAYQALEDAHLRPGDIAGREVGVYVGASSLDHGAVMAADPGMIDRYFMTGNTLSVISNRLSHNLNLRGPSFTIDTACSSSMVALTQAVSDIKAGRIDTALVAGVNLLFNPISFIGFSRAMMLSPTGLCRPFSSAADGYVRAEGALAIVLQRSDVATPGTVRARIIEARSNNDGRTSGVALPGLDGQMDLLRQTYDSCGISVDKLAFVEAHGTGTQVGDAIEGRAVGEVLGKARSSPLPIGSVKSNIGHLEPASGMAGLIKALCAIETRRLPASLHIDRLNPNIPFDELGLAPATRAVTLGEGDIYCGVSSFGFGGSNAHVVLGSPPPLPAPSDDETVAGNSYIVVSAASEAATAKIAEAHRQLLSEGISPARLAKAVTHGRDLMRFRTVLAMPPGQDLGLSRLISAKGHAPSAAAKVCLFYSGNGSQWLGMGRTAYEANCAFRERADYIDAIYARFQGRSIVADLFSEASDEAFGRADFIQPLIYAVQSATTAALAAEGVTADVVLGHSIGEIAAAETAGLISVQQAVRIIVARGACLDTIRGKGRMAVLSADVKAAEEQLAAFGADGIEIAADNGPSSVTVTGPADDVAKLVQFCRRRRVAARLMDLEYPFHSRFLDGLRDRLLEEIGEFTASPATIPFISTVTGEELPDGAMQAEYWWQNFRMPVKFRQAVAAAGTAGANLFIEIGARQIMQSPVQQTLRESGHSAEVLASLTQADDKIPARDPIVRVTARALAHGASLAKETERNGKYVVDRSIRLPRYAWQRGTYHYRESTDRLDIFGSQPRHPLIGARIMDFAHEWRTLLDTAMVPYLADHVIDGEFVVPAAGLAEMVLAIGRELNPEGPIGFEDLAIFKAMTLPANSMQEVCVRHAPETGMVTINSRKRFGGDEWTLNAKARLVEVSGDPQPVASLGPVKAKAAMNEIYRCAKAFGIEYGPSFRLVKSMKRSEKDIRVKLKVPETNAGAFQRKHLLAPQSFDAALHSLFENIASRKDSSTTYLPTRIGRVRLYRDGAEIVEAALHLLRETEQSLTVRISLLDQDGMIVADADGVFLRAFHLKKSRKGAEFFVARMRELDGAPIDPEALAALRVDIDTDTEDAIGLLRAHMHATAYSALSALANTDGHLDLASAEMQGKLAPNAAPLAKRLADELVDYGFAEIDGQGYTFNPTEDLPDADRILVTFAVDYPEASSDIVLASLTAAKLPAFLVEGTCIPIRSEVMRQFMLESVIFQPCAQLLLNSLPLLAPESRRHPSIVLLGSSIESLLKPLAPLAARGKIDLALAAGNSVEARRLHQLANNLPRVRVFDLAQPGNKALFDVALINAVVGDDAKASYLERAIELLGDDGCLACLMPTRDSLLDFCIGATQEGGSGALLPLRDEDVAANMERLNCRLAKARPISKDGSGAQARFVVAKVPPRPQIACITPISVQAGSDRSKLVAGELRKRLSRSGRKATMALSDFGEAVVFVDAGAGNPALQLRKKILSIVSLARGGRQGKRVWLVFRGAFGSPADPMGEALWSLARVLMNEFTECDLRLVDIDPSFSAEDAAQRLAALVNSSIDEWELHLGPDGVSGIRAEKQRLKAEEAPEALVLNTAAQGASERMVWMPTKRQVPGLEEIEVRVASTGLNFRDVMLSMGLLDDDVLEGGAIGAVMGFECSGHVVRVGEGVSGFRPGDAVIGFAPNAFATHLTAPAFGFQQLPEGASIAAAGGVPVAFLTAWYSLVEQARLRPGETVLVHGAAGGVGLAAIQISKAIGARIVATVSGPDKEAVARLYGADIVYNSRSLAFADSVKEDLGGVDVVLNSLNADAMQASIKCLKPFGRFVELGKRDYLENTEIGLRPFKRNLTYYGVDIDQLVAHAPKTIERGLRHIFEQMESGIYSPLPCRVFEAAFAEDAFRLMQGSGHVGKIMIKAPDLPREDTTEAGHGESRDKPDFEGVQLVVGGTGGFGFALAAWLAGQGARKIVVASRKGKLAEEYEGAAKDLREAGVDLRVERVNAANAQSVESMVKRVTSRMGNITGVFHTAAVLSDGLAETLDARAIDDVLAPKVRGALNLDEKTRGQPIRHFVMFSSISALVGNVGQAAYAAANGFLNGLARKRRDESLPALSVGWGAISDTGMLARDGTTAKLLEKVTGSSGMSSTEALGALGTLLNGGGPDGPVIYISKPYAGNAASSLRILAGPSYSALLSEAAGTESHTTSNLLEKLEGKTEKEAQQIMLGMIVEEVANILHLDPSEVNEMKPLGELGMDSLMALELRMNVESNFGVELPLVAITSLKNLSELSQRIVGELKSTPSDVEVFQNPEETALYHIHGGA